MSINQEELEKKRLYIQWENDTKTWRTIQNYITVFNRGKKVPSLKLVSIYGFYKKDDGTWDVPEETRQIYDIPKPDCLKEEEPPEDLEIQKREAREKYEMELRPWKNIVNYLRLFNRGVKSPTPKMVEKYGFFQKEDGTWAVPQEVREKYDIPLPDILQDKTQKTKIVCEEHQEMVEKRKSYDANYAKKRYKKYKSLLKAQSYVSQINQHCRIPTETTIKKYDLRQDENGKWVMSEEMIQSLKSVVES
jgi:hypothetical protein